MYTLKLTHGYVGEPETWTTETLGIYESLDEACEAAEREFYSALEDLTDPCETGFGEVEHSRYSHYATYGAYDVELGCMFAGYDRFCRVKVVEGQQHKGGFRLRLADLLDKYLDGMDVIAVKRYGSEYLVMYHDGRNVCTPYIIHVMGDSGLYSGRYYANEDDAKEEF